MNEKIKEILDEMEVYTVGRQYNQQVYISVRDFQKYIDDIREVLNEEECHQKG